MHQRESDDNLPGQNVETPMSQCTKCIFIGCIIAEICHGHIWSHFVENRSDGIPFVLLGRPDLYATLKRSKAKNHLCPGSLTKCDASFA